MRPGFDLELKLGIHLAKDVFDKLLGGVDQRLVEGNDEVFIKVDLST